MSNISLLKKKAETGDVQAMRTLAMAYMEGNGVAKNIDEVFNWMEKAAELGDAESQADLADMLRAMEEFNVAFSWEKKAAEQNYPKSQYNLGYCFREGIGTQKNPEKSFFWFSKAANNGLANAQCSVGVCYLLGHGTQTDYQQAIHWLEQAANGGDAEAKRRLGAAYVQGIGCTVDKEKGEALLREAAALGDNKAKEILNSGELRRGSGGGCLVFVAALGTLLTSGVCGLAFLATMAWKF